MKSLTGLLRLAGLLVFILLISSCQKDDPALDENFEGSFELTVTGDESYTLKGVANYSQVIVDEGTPESQGTVLSMTFMQDDQNALALSLIKIQTNGFGEGTYSYLEDPSDDQVFLSLSFYSAESQKTYLLSSGSVTFDDVSNKLIEGSMNVQMSDFMGSTINVSGTFKAKGLLLGFGI